MIYDSINKQTFEEIKTCWNNKIKEKCYTDLIYLLGNKKDLNDNSEEKAFADKNNIKYFSISNKNSIQNFIDDLKINIEKINSNNDIIDGNSSKDEYKVIFLGDRGVSAKTTLIDRIL